MAKIKPIESFHSTKRTTIRYKGLKIRLFTKRVAIPKVDSTTNPVVIFLQKDIFKPFSFEGSSKLVFSFQMPVEFNIFFIFWVLYLLKKKGVNQSHACVWQYTIISSISIINDVMSFAIFPFPFFFLKRLQTSQTVKVHGFPSNNVWHKYVCVGLYVLKPSLICLEIKLEYKYSRRRYTFDDSPDSHNYGHQNTDDSYGDDGQNEVANPHVLCKDYEADIVKKCYTLNNIC